MKKLLSVFIPSLLIACSTLAQDTVVLHNGDILTGKILKQDAESVYFRSSAFGSVSLRTADISEIRIHTPGLGEITVPSDAMVEQKQEKAPTEKIVKKAPAAKKNPVAKKKDPWSGQAGLAVAMRESNTLRRSGDTLREKNEEFESYRVYGNINWKGEQNRLRWDWTYRYSRTDIRKNDDYLNVTQKYQHDFSPKYYASTKTLYQRDFRRGIEHEYLQTAELGIKWFDTPKFKFSTSAGGGYHKYERLKDIYSDANAKFILDESIRWQMINSLTLFQKYTHLGSLDKYHLVFTTGLENKLIRDVFLRMEYRLDRDTEVDYDDRGYYDKALLTSLLYKF